MERNVLLEKRLVLDTLNDNTATFIIPEETEEDLDYTDDELVATAGEMGKLLFESVDDICMGNNRGKLVLSQLIDFCKDVGSSGYSVMELLEPGVLGIGEGTEAIIVSCIAACYSRNEQFSKERTEEIIIAGLLHDIGLYNDEITYGLQEHAVHVMKGYNRLLKCADDRISREVRDAVMQHHERYNGSGYPFGIKGTAVSVTAMIIELIEQVLKISRYQSKTQSIYDELKTQKEGFDPVVFNNFCGLAFGEVE